MTFTAWAGVLTLAATVSCSPKSVAPERRDSLKAAIATEVTNFYLKDSLQKNVWNFNLLFAQSLFLRTDSAEIVGDLADSLSFESPRVVNVRLRRGAKFHNESPVGCEDIVWSFEDARHPGSPYQSTFEQILSWSCKDQIFQIQLKRPVHGLIERLLSGIRIYPKRAYPKRSAAPIGSGPYRFISSTPLKSVWRRFEHYQGPLRAEAKTIEIYYIHDARTRYEWLKLGKLDLLLEWPAEMDPILSREGPSKLDVHQYRGSGSLVVGLSMRSPCFSNLQNRRKFAEAIHEYEHLLIGFTAAPPFSTDPSKTTATVKRKVTLCKDLQLMYPAGSSFAHLGVRLMQGLLKSLNIRSAAQESSVFYAKLAAGQLDAFVVSLPTAEDAVALYEYMHSTQMPPQKNRFFYASPAADRLLENLQLSPNSPERARTLEALAEQVESDVPFIPLGTTLSKLVSRKGVMIRKSIATHPWLMMIEAVKKTNEL